MAASNESWWEEETSTKEGQKDLKDEPPMNPPAEQPRRKEHGNYHPVPLNSPPPVYGMTPSSAGSYQPYPPDPHFQYGYFPPPVPAPLYYPQYLPEDSPHFMSPYPARDNGYFMPDRDGMADVRQMTPKFNEGECDRQQPHNYEQRHLYSPVSAQPVSPQPSTEYNPIHSGKGAYSSPGPYPNMQSPNHYYSDLPYSHGHAYNHQPYLMRPYNPSQFHRQGYSPHYDQTMYSGHSFSRYPDSSGYFPPPPPHTPYPIHPNAHSYMGHIPQSTDRYGPTRPHSIAVPNAPSSPEYHLNYQEELMRKIKPTNFPSAFPQKMGMSVTRKRSVLSADSLENVSNPLSPMTPNSPLSPDYQDGSSSSTPFSPTLPPSSLNEQQLQTTPDTANDSNNHGSHSSLHAEVEHPKPDRKCSLSEISHLSNSLPSLGSFKNLDKNSQGSRRNSDESQYDNVPETLDETIESSPPMSPQVCDVGFVRATLDTPQTLLASTQLVKATLKPSKPTTFFIALESKFKMPEFEENGAFDTKGILDDDSHSDTICMKGEQEHQDNSYVANREISNITPTDERYTDEFMNVSTSPADYQESQLVMRHFVESLDKLPSNDQIEREDIDEFFLILDSNGSAATFEFPSGNSSPRSSCSESFYDDSEIENCKTKLSSAILEEEEEDEEDSLESKFRVNKAFIPPQNTEPSYVPSFQTIRDRFTQEESQSNMRNPVTFTNVPHITQFERFTPKNKTFMIPKKPESELASNTQSPNLSPLNEDSTSIDMNSKARNFDIVTVSSEPAIQDSVTDSFDLKHSTSDLENDSTAPSFENNSAANFTNVELGQKSSVNNIIPNENSPTTFEQDSGELSLGHLIAQHSMPQVETATSELSESPPKNTPQPSAARTFLQNFLGLGESSVKLIKKDAAPVKLNKTVDGPSNNNPKNSIKANDDLVKNNARVNYLMFENPSVLKDIYFDGTNRKGILEENNNSIKFIDKQVNHNGLKVKSKIPTVKSILKTKIPSSSNSSALFKHLTEPCKTDAVSLAGNVENFSSSKKNANKENYELRSNCVISPSSMHASQDLPLPDDEEQKTSNAAILEKEENSNRSKVKSCDTNSNQMPVQNVAITTGMSTAVSPNITALPKLHDTPSQNTKPRSKSQSNIPTRISTNSKLASLIATKSNLTKTDFKDDNRSRPDTKTSKGSNFNKRKTLVPLKHPVTSGTENVTAEDSNSTRIISHSPTSNSKSAPSLSGPVKTQVKFNKKSGIPMLQNAKSNHSIVHSNKSSLPKIVKTKNIAKISGIQLKTKTQSSKIVQEVPQENSVNSKLHGCKHGSVVLRNKSLCRSLPSVVCFPIVKTTLKSVHSLSKLKCSKETSDEMISKILLTLVKEISFRSQKQPDDSPLNRSNSLSKLQEATSESISVEIRSNNVTKVQDIPNEQHLSHEISSNNLTDSQKVESEQPLSSQISLGGMNENSSSTELSGSCYPYDLSARPTPSPPNSTTRHPSELTLSQSESVASERVHVTRVSESVVPVSVSALANECFDSDVEISEGTLSDFSDDEIIISDDSEDDVEDKISEPLFIPSQRNSFDSVDNSPIFDLTNPNQSEQISDSFLMAEGAPRDSLPYLKHEELDRLATVIASKLLRGDSIDNEVINSVLSEEGEHNYSSIMNSDSGVSFSGSDTNTMSIIADISLSSAPCSADDNSLSGTSLYDCSVVPLEVSKEITCDHDSDTPLQPTTGSPKVITCRKNTYVSKVNSMEFVSGGSEETETMSCAVHSDNLAQKRNELAVNCDGQTTDISRSAVDNYSSNDLIERNLMEGSEEVERTSKHEAFNLFVGDMLLNECMNENMVSCNFSNGSSISLSSANDHEVGQCKTSESDHSRAAEPSPVLNNTKDTIEIARTTTSTTSDVNTSNTLTKNNQQQSSSDEDNYSNDVISSSDDMFLKCRKYSASSTIIKSNPSTPLSVIENLNDNKPFGYNDRSNKVFNPSTLEELCTKAYKKYLNRVYVDRKSKLVYPSKDFNYTKHLDDIEHCGTYQTHSLVQLTQNDSVEHLGLRINVDSGLECGSHRKSTCVPISSLSGSDIECVKLNNVHQSERIKSNDAELSKLIGGNKGADKLNEHLITVSSTFNSMLNDRTFTERMGRVSDNYNDDVPIKYGGENTSEKQCYESFRRNVSSTLERISSFSAAGEESKPAFHELNGGCMSLISQTREVKPQIIELTSSIDLTDNEKNERNCSSRKRKFQGITPNKSDRSNQSVHVACKGNSEDSSIEISHYDVDMKDILARRRFLPETPDEHARRKNSQNNSNDVIVPVLDDLDVMKQRAQKIRENVDAILEKSGEEQDKSDGSCEEIFWDVNMVGSKPDRKYSDSSGISSISDSSHRKFSNSSVISNDDWNWFPGRKTSNTQENGPLRKFSSSSGYTSGIESMDSRKVSLSSNCTNLDIINEESNYLRQSNVTESGKALPDHAVVREGVLPLPPSPVWPGAVKKPVKPPRRSILGIIDGNHTINSRVLQAKGWDSALPSEKKVDQMRARRRTLHTFSNIFNEWENRSKPAELVSDVTFTQFSNSKSEDMLLGISENNDKSKEDDVKAESLSVVGNCDNGKSLRSSEIYRDSPKKYLIDSTELGKLSPLNSYEAVDPIKTFITDNTEQNKDDPPVKTLVKKIETVVLRDAHSLPNLADVGEANMLDADEPVVPLRKKRCANSTKVRMLLNKSDFSVDDNYCHKSELDVRCETFHSSRVAHAQSDDAILEQAYCNFSKSDGPVDNPENFESIPHELDDELRVGLPRRQGAKQSKRSLKLNDLKRKFSFNSMERSKDIKESFTMSLQRFKKAKTKFEKLVNKSLKKDSPTPTLVRSSQVPVSFDRASTIDEESLYSSWNSSKTYRAPSVSSCSSSQSRYSCGEPRRVNHFQRVKKTSRSLNFEFVNAPLDTKSNTMGRHFEQPPFDASECCSVDSWSDAHSDFEYYKMRPAHRIFSPPGIEVHSDRMTQSAVDSVSRYKDGNLRYPRKQPIRTSPTRKIGQVPPVEISFSGAYIRSDINTSRYDYPLKVQPPKGGRVVMRGGSLPPDYN